MESFRPEPPQEKGGDKRRKLTAAGAALIAGLSAAGAASAEEPPKALSDELRTEKSEILDQLGDAKTEAQQALAAGEDAFNVLRTFETTAASLQQQHLEGAISGLAERMGVNNEQAAEILQSLSQPMQELGGVERSADSAMTELLVGLGYSRDQAENMRDAVEAGDKAAFDAAGGV